MPSEKYINRELSWLSFNQRVLQEASDRTVPLLERLKFLGIFSSNLDEFYRVRVATHTRIMNASGKGQEEISKKILNQIQEKVIKLRDEFDTVFTNVLDQLEPENIFMINEKELDEQQKIFIKNYFEEEVRPRLVPVMISENSKFPYLENQVIYLAVHLSLAKNREMVAYALIELPESLPRFIVLPQQGKKRFLIMLDDVIRFGLSDIFFNLDFDTFSAFTVKLTRDAEFEISDDITKSFYEKISKSIKDRHKGQVVRFVYDRNMPEDLRDFIIHSTKIKKADLISGGRYHNARDFIGFPTLGLKHLVYKQLPSLMHRDFKPKTSLLDDIKKKDVLLHYPYHSYHYVIDLLREAAIDPKVKSIKITLYRLAEDSNVINTLINAMRNGKSVTVVIELQARFDEAANIKWTEQLTAEGARILDGVPGFKVHAKLLQILREEENEEALYTYISTGNFNESTAKLYVDHGLFTAHKEISKEVKNVFDFLEFNYKNYKYKHLLVSPFYMRKKLFKLINNEIKIAQSGNKAHIYLKLNNLVDQDLIDKLYEASQAGVKIRMLIRGICSLIPGLAGISENIEGYSIIDRFLEHSRIIVFGNNGEEKYFLSSADWMVRNLDNRIEVATPVYDKEIQKELKDYLKVQFNESVKARILNQTQNNPYRSSGKMRGPRVQLAQYKLLKKRQES